VKTGASGIVAALDVGYVKTSCLIARIGNDGAMEALGAAQQLSRGTSGGHIVDVKKAEEAVRSVVAAAEKMAGVNIHEVIVAVNGNRQASRRMAIRNELKDTVTAGAVLRMVDKGCRRFREEGRMLLHGIPLDFAIDGTSGIREPAGMYASEIGVDVHMVDGDASSIMNLAKCLARCHLDMHDIVNAAYAAGLACLTETEREMGTLLVDFGGGNTSVALFKDNLLHYVDTFPLGAAHITRDVAVGLSTSPENAERLKALYGSVIPSQNDDHEMVEFVHMADLAVGKREASYAQRSQLVAIIQARVEEIVGLLQKRLPEGLPAQAPGGIVITGGGSCLTGLADYVALKFGKSVRIGRPGACKGLPESMTGPIFSSTVGVLHYYRYKKQMLAVHLKEYYRKKKPHERLIDWMRDHI
jgi:cell division protein FtsA